MTKTLNQDRLFSSRKFVLTDNELSVKIKSLKESKEFIIKLETLGQELYYHSDPPIIKNVVAAVCGIIPIIITIAYFFSEEPPDKKTTYIVNIIIWTPMAIILFLLNGKKDVHIIGGQNTVTFYQNVPDKTIVDKFVQEVLQSSKACIYRKYVRVDADLPEEQQMGIFHWLYSKDIISEKEYDLLKQEYKEKRIL